MADISVEQKKGGNLTWLWATLAILSVIGLMAWLASQEVDEGPVAVEGDDPAAAEAEAALQGEAVELAAVGSAPASFVGRTVVVRDVTVAATLGPRSFWADIPGQNPFLVILGPAVANPEIAAAQAAVNLQGTVEPVTPELLDQWVQDGAVNEGQREEATFADHYMLASRMTAGQAAPAQQQEQPAQQQPVQAPAGQ